MMKSRPTSAVVSGTILAFACIAWLSAGPLNPPSGPVSSGGKTTQEIFDAVTGNSLAIGAVGGRGPAVPGANVAAGSFTLSTNPAMSGPILGMRSSLLTPTTIGTGGGTSSRTVFESLTIVRNMGGTATPAFRNLVGGTSLNSCTVTIPSNGGNTVYTLTNVFVSGLRHSTIQRADGTYAAIEEIDLVPTILRITDPSGNTWSYNYQTLAGGP
jgi:hypothetical protein